MAEKDVGHSYRLFDVVDGGEGEEVNIEAGKDTEVEPVSPEQLALANPLTSRSKT